MDPNAVLRVFMRLFESIWVLVDFYRFLCVFMGPLVSLIIFMRPYVSLWVLISRYVSLLVLMRPYGLNVSLCLLMLPYAFL